MIYIVDNGERFEDNAVAFVRVHDDLVRAYPEIIQAVSAGELGTGGLICSVREEHVEWRAPTAVLEDWTAYLRWWWFAKLFRPSMAERKRIPAPEGADVLGVHTTSSGEAEVLYRLDARPTLPAGAITALLAAWRSEHTAERIKCEERLARPSVRPQVRDICARNLVSAEWVLNALDTAHAAGRLTR